MTKFKNLYFFFLLVPICFTSCIGQTKTEQPNEIVVEPLSYTSKSIKLTKTQGTSEHQNVNRSLQDKKGNLWFTTTGEGVYRYDGKEFMQFTEKDGLSDNAVLSILEDKLGNIWLGTDDGVSLYDGKKISKIPFTNANGAAIAQSPKNSVWSIFQDQSGIIWFGTSQDLYCYDGKSFSRFLDKRNIINDQNLQLKSIQCFTEDNNGTIWMGSGPFGMEGVIRYDGNAITSSKPNGDGWIRYMLKAKNNTIWFGGRSNGNFVYNGKDFKSFTEKVGIGNPILIDQSGNIWFSGEEKLSTVESEGGIWRYDGKTFKNYNTTDGISKYFVFSMLEDKAGNIWIGTRNCGLYRYNGHTFEVFSE